MAESEELEEELRRHRANSSKAVARASGGYRDNDEVVRLLHRKRAAHHAQFLCGTAKRQLVEKRRAADSRVRDQYYDYRF